MAESRILELDSLRALAAFGVVGSHLYPGLLFGMGTFVYLFFVLSGFLITRILLGAETPIGTTLRHFWIRRILRIWPVYYLTLMGVVAYTALSFHSDTVPDGSFRGTVAALVFLQYTEYYFHPHAPFPPEFLTHFGHSWTLAVEEQFYFIWPLAALYFLRRPRILSALCLAAVALGIFARSRGIPGFVLLGGADALAIGALIAVIERQGYLPRWDTGPLPPWLIRVMGYGCLLAAPLFVRYLWVGYKHPDHYRDLFVPFDSTFMIAAYAFVYGCVVLLLVHFAGHPALAVLRRPAPVYLGTISYAVYMFHVPIIGVFEVGLRITGLQRGPFVDGLIVGTIVATASASYFLMERPLSNLKRRFQL